MEKIVWLPDPIFCLPDIQCFSEEQIGNHNYCLVNQKSAGRSCEELGYGYPIVDSEQVLDEIKNLTVWRSQ